MSGCNRQRGVTAFDVFYRRYVAACLELRAVPLTRSELLALIDCLARRAAATLLDPRVSLAYCRLKHSRMCGTTPHQLRSPKSAPIRSIRAFQLQPVASGSCRHSAT
jgi:hypothetical protein